MPLTVVNNAENYPVGLTELKSHIRLGGSSPGSYTVEDSTLEAMIGAATIAFQERYKVQLITATLRWDFAEFRRMMELARPPFLSVDKVEYVDEDGDTQLIPESDYSTFKFERMPGRVAFDNEYEFPELNELDPYPVKVTYKAGYGDTHADVPEDTKLWLKNTIGTYYMQRESRLISYTGNISVQEMAKEMAFLLKGTPKGMRVG